MEAWQFHASTGCSSRTSARQRLFQVPTERQPRFGPPRESFQIVSHLFVGISSLWLMFRAPVSLFYHTRKEAGVRTAKIKSMLVESGSSQLSFHPFSPLSAPTLPLPLELDRADLARPIARSSSTTFCLTSLHLQASLHRREGRWGKGSLNI